MHFHLSLVRGWTKLWATAGLILQNAIQRGAIPVMAGVLGMSVALSPALALEFPPTQKGAPARTSGGGVRDPKDALTPFLPGDGIHSFACEQATLLIHVPENLNREALLLVLNDDETLFEQEFQLPESSGLVGITLPVSVAQKMVVEQTYDWEFAVLPDGDIQREEKIVRGQIQRLASASQTCAQSDSPLSIAEHFSKQGIWQETVLAIAPVHQTYAAEWQSLLKSVKIEGFDDIAWSGVISLDP